MMQSKATLVKRTSFFEIFCSFLLFYVSLCRLSVGMDFAEDPMTNHLIKQDYNGSNNHKREL